MLSIEEEAIIVAFRPSQAQWEAPPVRRVALLAFELGLEVEGGPKAAVHVERHGCVLVRDLPDAVD